MSDYEWEWNYRYELEYTVGNLSYTFYCGPKLYRNEINVAIQRVSVIRIPDKIIVINYTSYSSGIVWAHTFDRNDIKISYYSRQKDNEFTNQCFHLSIW